MDVTPAVVLASDARSLHLAGGGVQFEGVMFSTTRLVFGGEGTPKVREFTDLGGRGNYRLEYRGEVGELSLSSPQRVLYRGPPIERLNTGPGAVQLEIKGTGRLGVRLIDSCTIGSQWEFFARS